MININIVFTYAPQFFWALLTTLQIALSACVIGIVIGSMLGLILVNYKGVPYSLASLYTSIIRGTPMLVQLFIVYYVLPYIGINLSAKGAAIVACGINSGAYVAHMVRGGIQAVPRGQWEAAQTLGLSTTQTLWYIILPQAISIILPMFGNELITLIKDSSLASTIGVAELTKVANQIRSTTYDALTPLFIIASIYFIITWTASLLLSYLEKQYAHHI